MQPNQTVLASPRRPVYAVARLFRITIGRGYLIIADALPSAMISSARAEAVAICRLRFAARSMA